MFSLERATTARRAGVWTLVGLILVPLVVAGGFLWAGWNSSDRLGRVQAAIVNNDDPVTIDEQLVPLGRQLAGGLVSADDDPNFSWLITDDEDAAAGLASGAYAAVVTIPESFSKNATSYSKDDPDEVKHATIDVQTSQITGLADPVVGQAITAQATKVLNATLTEGYLKNIYIGFNQTGKQFTTLATAAGKLSDGTTGLSDGIRETEKGTGTFASGLTQLDSGAQELSSGVGQYATGVGTFADGVDQLADGTSQSAAGAEKLAKGGDRLADGADGIADGATQVAGGLKALQNGSEQTQGLGTTPFAAGVTQYAAGSKAYRDGVIEYAGGVGAFAGGLNQYADAFQALSEADPDEVADLNAQLACPEELSEEGCDGWYAGLKAGTTAAYQGLQSPDGGDTPGLADAATQLSQGATALAGGAKELSDGATGLAQGAGGLDQILTALRFGTDPDEVGGFKAFVAGTKTFAGGVGDYTDGVGQLATGLGKLASGTNELAGGGRQLATGADQLATGTSQLADGTAQSADGAQQLYAGVGQLADGGEELADGTEKFADGLDQGKDQVPSFSKELRNTLSSVVTTPVKTPTSTEIFPNQASTTLLTVIALWLGALASFLLLRTMSSRVLSSMKPSWRLALEGVLPAVAVTAVQALALSGVLGALLDLDGRAFGALTVFALLTGVTFAVINHALVAWFGGVGRFISVAVLVLAAAGTITSALPAAFDTITPFLPTTPALEGLRAIVSDGPGAGHHAALLVAWLLIAGIASVLAVARRRVLDPLRAPVPA